MAQHDKYISPFSTRYASDEMQYIFSDDNKFRTWRRLWIALAKAEQKQGLAITDEQIAELEAHKDDINYDVAAAREKERSWPRVLPETDRSVLVRMLSTVSSNLRNLAERRNFRMQ